MELPQQVRSQMEFGNEGTREREGCLLLRRGCVMGSGVFFYPTHFAKGANWMGHGDFHWKNERPAAEAGSIAGVYSGS